eukprot:6210301-Pleurochrysis_carterae.AAC.4
MKSGSQRDVPEKTLGEVDEKRSRVREGSERRFEGRGVRERRRWGWRGATRCAAWSARREQKRPVERLRSRGGCVRFERRMERFRETTNR